jgi:arylamine N-acetyltransferase
LDGPPTPDLEGLRTLYRAWRLKVPFDNIHKTLALFRSRSAVLPVLDPTDFFEHWIDHGTGGTCWPSANALHALLCDCGFDAHRATASMFDSGPPDHATVLVRLEDGSNWVTDIHVSLEPLRIDPEAPSYFPDPTSYAEVEVAGADVFIYGVSPPSPRVFFRLLELDVAERVFDDRYEDTREISKFNDRVHIQRCFPHSIRVVRGADHFELNSDGLHRERLDEAGLRERLVGEMGLGAAIVDRLAARGVLKASAAIPEAAPINRPERIPPSARQ